MVQWLDGARNQELKEIRNLFPVLWIFSLVAVLWHLKRMVRWFVLVVLSPQQAILTLKKQKMSYRFSPQAPGVVMGSQPCGKMVR